jgi:hypothetical protein
VRVRLLSQENNQASSSLTPLRDEHDTLPRKKTDDAVDALAVKHALAGRDGVPGEFRALADLVAVAASLGDGWCVMTAGSMCS